MAATGWGAAPTRPPGLAGLGRRRRAVAVLAASAGAVLTLLTLVPGLLGTQVRYLPSGNMERTFPVGSYAVVSREPAGRGDVVVYRSSPFPGAPAREFVQRVIASGGDTVRCCDAEGRVVRNDVPLVEPYLFEDDRAPFGPVLVPEGRLFVAGDHRSASADSRSLSDDPVERTVAAEDVLGVASGPYGRVGAHARVVGQRLVVALAVAVPALVLTELVLLRRRRSGAA